jgi:hypothetical protein
MKEAAQVLRCHNGHALRISRDAFREANGPAPLAFVHAEKNAALGGRVVAGGIKQQKVRSQLSHWNRMPVKKKANPDIGRVAAVTD